MAIPASRPRKMVPFESFTSLPFIVGSYWKNIFEGQNGHDPRMLKCEGEVGENADIEANLFLALASTSLCIQNIDLYTLDMSIMRFWLDLLN
jgi:hypothetical protein